jgi:hypothetical protein
MTVWHPLSLIQAFLPFQERRAGARMVRRWTNIARDDSRLAEDLIRLGGILTGQPAQIVDGFPAPDLPDAQLLAYQAGRRDMALQLLALMSLTPHQLNTLVKEPDYAEPYDD